MRKLLTLLAALSIFGCQKNELNYQEQNLESKTFIATFDENCDTKTSLDSDGNVFWKKGNEVSIFAGSTYNQHYKVTDASDGKTTAELTLVQPTSFVAGNEINNNVALYPYTSSASIRKSESNYVISDITLPSAQTYTAGSFGNGVFPMVAVTSSTEDKILKFKNVLGCIKLQLTGTACIASIKITGNNDEILCGSASITASTEATPSITLTDASAKTVTLNCGEGAQLNSSTATVFIITLPPVAMSNGFTVVVTDTDGGSMTIKTENEQTISRSSILKMPEKTYTPDQPQEHASVDLGLSVKWATCNLGAESPSDYGDYFAWAETSPKETYDWTNLRYRISGDSYSNVKFSKYVTTSDYGTVDNKKVLETEDDAATANWGSDWRMPTYTEWQDLCNSSYCTWEWTTEGGHNGYKVTSKKNGNSIFLPAAGYLSGSGSYYVGTEVYYWSSSLYAGNSYGAYACYFNSTGVDPSDWGSRRCGQLVRPVSSSSQN